MSDEEPVAKKRFEDSLPAHRLLFQSETHPILGCLVFIVPIFASWLWAFTDAETSLPTKMVVGTIVIAMAAFASRKLNPVVDRWKP